LEQILKVLYGKTNNYLFPFFGVPENVDPETLRADLARLASNGIKGICIEPNGNKNYTGQGWWEQMDAIMDEARLRGIRVWLQDEPTFPTGSANGFAVEYPELQKVYLEERHIDTVGPQSTASFFINSFLDINSLAFYIRHMGEEGVPTPSVTFGIGSSLKNTDKGGGNKARPKLLCVSACRKTGQGYEVDGNYIDLTEKVNNGILEWDVPEGSWRIFIIYTSQFGNGRPNYLNLFDSQAVKLLIEKLYKPHYERYKHDFGRAFAGFFSDEPEFGNVAGYGNDNSIGRKQMPLPWSRELGIRLLEKLEEKAYAVLPALWHESGADTAKIRYAYMDILTRLYEKNFSRQIGDWCKAHGCEYIGHVVEDMGIHSRLGAGTGHYFRSMAGQDYAGIDVVHIQIRPGLDEPGFSWFTGDTGGEFFHYGLAKLGSSAAHIDPEKKGRSICEMFAAFGYSLGLKSQKWLFDHMLVRGINSFIPTWHTIYNGRGKGNRYDGDPQFRYNHILSQYVNRLCSIFNNGVHIAPAAVLYHAEAEWSGDFMEFEKPVRVLLQNQIDCDIVPSDVFSRREYYQTKVGPNGLKINQETYKALIIPYSRYITRSLAMFINECRKTGFPVFFIDALPEGIVDGMDDERETALMDAIAGCLAVPLEEISNVLKERNLHEISADDSPKGLRYYHYRNEKSDVFMFFNEEPADSIKTVVEIPINKPAVCYDPFMNRLHRADTILKNGTTRLSLTLSPYESYIVIFDKDASCFGYTDKPVAAEIAGDILHIKGPWNVSFSDRNSYPLFTRSRVLDNLINLSAKEYCPDFSGTLRYDTVFYLENTPEKALLSLGEVYETADVSMNGVSVGVRICPPYRFDISGLLKKGENFLRIDVVNTLVHEKKDVSSAFAAIEPSGLLGPVNIECFSTRL
jgi:hypothetical protein